MRSRLRCTAKKSVTSEPNHPASPAPRCSPWQCDPTSRIGSELLTWARFDLPLTNPEGLPAMKVAHPPPIQSHPIWSGHFGPNGRSNSVMLLGAEEASAGLPLDEHAFTLLIDSHLPGAYRLAYGMLGSKAEAEDAVQEAAVNAWRGFGRFRKEARIEPWFYAIVANQCRTQLRRLRRRNEVEMVADDATPIFPDPSSMDLKRALDRLPADQRLLIVLRYYLDLPFQDVAAILSVSPKAARSRTYRALERLRLMPEVLSDE